MSDQASASKGIKLRDKLDSQGFYELMQAYRHVPIEQQEQVVVAFEAVKAWIRQWIRGERRC